MSGSLPFLNAIAKQSLEIQSMSFGFGGMAGSSEVKEKTATSRDDFMAVVNG